MRIDLSNITFKPEYSIIILIVVIWFFSTRILASQELRKAGKFRWKSINMLKYGLSRAVFPCLLFYGFILLTGFQSLNLYLLLEAIAFGTLHSALVYFYYLNEKEIISLPLPNLWIEEIFIESFRDDLNREYKHYMHNKALLFLRRNCRNMSPKDLLEATKRYNSGYHTKNSPKHNTIRHSEDNYSENKNALSQMFFILEIEEICEKDELTCLQVLDRFVELYGHDELKILKDYF